MALHARDHLRAMSARTGCLLGRIQLRFGEEKNGYVPEDLSAIARQRDGTLWLAADERAALDRLRAPGHWAHVYAEHRHLSIASALGVADDAEIDIEGIADDGGALWVAGSHSAKRRKPKNRSRADDLERLATVETELARFVLARIPFTGGELQLDRRALLAAHTEGESLMDLLAGDEHLAAFLPAADGRPVVPGKDNGFDVEGIAVREGSVLLGLRGPVLRGWAFVLELVLEPDGHGDLRARSNRKASRAYRKHALDLDGLGVRDLMVRGDDVLIVAGPTMVLDGAHRVFRWRPSAGTKDSVLHQGDGELEPLFDLPMQIGRDRAEGVCTFGWYDEDDSVLVVYDAPSEMRRMGAACVLADVFAID